VTAPDPSDAPTPSETDGSRDLESQIRELSAITGGLAHELRNPLSTMRINLQLLEEDLRKVEDADEPDDREARDTARRGRQRLAMLLRETDRLERILAHFLLYIGRREYKLEPTDLDRLAEELVGFFRPEAEAGGVHLRFDAAPGQLICRVDANLVRQALFNLLVNAKQAMPDGGALTVRVAPEGERLVRIDVIDSGPGIPVDEQTRIFQAYYSTKKGGSGLGLAMARRIVCDHGGDLTVRSEPPNGACFSIRLPRENDASDVQGLP